MNVSRPIGFEPTPRLPDPAERSGAAPSGSSHPAAGTREGSDVPPGADPDVWRVLSTREREQLSRVAAMGPLTYGYLINSDRADLPVVRGGRIDLRA